MQRKTFSVLVCSRYFKRSPDLGYDTGSNKEIKKRIRGSAEGRTEVSPCPYLCLLLLSYIFHCLMHLLTSTSSVRVANNCTSIPTRGWRFVCEGYWGGFDGILKSSVLGFSTGRTSDRSICSPVWSCLTSPWWLKLIQSFYTLLYMCAS